MEKSDINQAAQTPPPPPAPPSATPSLLDSILVLLGVLIGLAMSPWIMGAISFETHKDFVRGGKAQRAAVAQFDQETEQGKAKYNALAAAGGDTAAEVALAEYEAKRAEQREPLIEALNGVVEARQTLLSRLRWGGLILAFGSIVFVLPAQLGLAVPPKLVKSAMIIAGVAGAVWMVCYIPDPNAADPVHRMLAVIIGLGIGIWGLWAKLRKPAAN